MADLILRRGSYVGSKDDGDKQPEPAVQAVEVGNGVLVVEAEDGHESHDAARKARQV